jgi:hypothetical protein
VTRREPRLLFTSEEPTYLISKNWIIRDVLAAGEISAIVAPPFVGKSALAGDMAATIGTGEPWFEHPTSQAATLYVAQERSAVMYRRLRAYEQYHKIKNLPVALLLDRLDLVNEVNLAKQLILDGVKSCEDHTGLSVKLITLDTVAALSPGTDENSSRDMGKFVDSVCRIRDTLGGRTHISLLHHTPQGDHRRLRGHSSLPGAIDVIILVSAKGKGRSWEVWRANDQVELPSASFELQSIYLWDDVQGVPNYAPVVVPVVAKERHQAGAAQAQPKALTPDGKAGLEIVKLLVNGEPITVKRFREAFKMSPAFKDRTEAAQRQAFKTVRTQLEASHLITVVGTAITVNMKAPGA